MVYVTIKWSCKFHLDFDQRPKFTKTLTEKRMRFDKGKWDKEIIF